MQEVDKCVEPALMLSMSLENMKYFCVIFVFNF